MGISTDRRNFLKGCGVGAGLLFGGCLERPKKEDFSVYVDLQTLTENPEKYNGQNIVTTGYPFFRNEMEMEIERHRLGIVYRDRDIYRVFSLYPTNDKTQKWLTIVDIDPISPIYDSRWDPRGVPMDFSGRIGLDFLTGEYVLISGEPAERSQRVKK